MSSKSTRKEEFKKQPVYWFVLLETAHTNGNTTEASRAKRQLAKLGIDVNFRGNRGRRVVEVPA